VLLAGADRRPITPALEGRVWLAGFQPNRPAVGVHDDLCARMQWNMGRAAQCRHGRRPQGDRAGYRLRTARSSEGTDQVAREVGCRETKEKAEQGPDNHVFDLLPAGACADVAEPEQGLCCKEKANERRKRECFVKSMAKWVMMLPMPIAMRVSMSRCLNWDRRKARKNKDARSDRGSNCLCVFSCPAILLPWIRRGGYNLHHLFSENTSAPACFHGIPASNAFDLQGTPPAQGPR